MWISLQYANQVLTTQGDILYRDGTGPPKTRNWYCWTSAYCKPAGNGVEWGDPNEVEE